MITILFHLLLIAVTFIVYFLLAFSLNKVVFTKCENMLSKAESLSKEVHNQLNKLHDYEQKFNNNETKKS